MYLIHLAWIDAIRTQSSFLNDRGISYKTKAQKKLNFFREEYLLGDLVIQLICNTELKQLHLNA